MKKTSRLNKKRQRSTWNFLQCYYAITGKLKRLPDYTPTHPTVVDFSKLTEEEILNNYYKKGMYKNQEKELMSINKSIKRLENDGDSEDIEEI